MYKTLSEFRTLRVEKKVFIKCMVVHRNNEGVMLNGPKMFLTSIIWAMMFFEASLSQPKGFYLIGLSTFSETNGKIMNQLTNITPRFSTIRWIILSSIYYIRILCGSIIARYENIYFLGDGPVLIEFFHVNWILVYALTD